MNPATMTQSFYNMQLNQDDVKQEQMEILNVNGTLLDQSYVAQIWNMNNALFVWMGLNTTTPSMNSMSTAVMTRYNPMPLVTPIVGDPEMEEQQIAQRLARRSGKQCFVSCQLPDHLPELVAYVEKQIVLRLTEANIMTTA